MPNQRAPSQQLTNHCLMQPHKEKNDTSHTAMSQPCCLTIANDPPKNPSPAKCLWSCLPDQWQSNFFLNKLMFGNNEQETRMTLKGYGNHMIWQYMFVTKLSVEMHSDSLTCMKRSERNLSLFSSRILFWSTLLRHRALPRHHHYTYIFRYEISIAILRCIKESCPCPMSQWQKNRVPNPKLRPY